MLAELTQVAESVGVEVKRSELRGNRPSLGGLCRLPGRTLVVLNAKASTLERCTILAHALAELGHAEHPGLGPESRALVEQRGRPGARRAPRAEVRSKGPGLAGLGGKGRRRV